MVDPFKPFLTGVRLVGAHALMDARLGAANQFDKR
jgi:hypothetical protein